MGTDSTDGYSLNHVRATRRQLLRSLVMVGAGVAGAVAVGCAANSSSSAPATSAPQATAAPASAWDTLLAAGRAEGKVVVSGPPDQIPQPGGKYFDTYDPEYVLARRQEARDSFAALLH
jgi:hypothetical protein